MKIKLKIQQKIQFFILGSAIIIFIISIGYIVLQVKKQVTDNAYELTESLVDQNSAKIEKSLEKDIVIVRTLAKVVEEYLDMPFDKRQALLAEGYFNVLRENPHIDAIWDDWDMKFLDHSMPDSILRSSYFCYWKNNIIKEEITFFDYYHPRFLKKVKKATEIVIDPYLYSYGKEDSILVTDLNAPIFNDEGLCIGDVSIDYKLTRFQEIVSEIKVFKSSLSFLVNNSGVFIGHTDPAMLGKNISEVYPDQSTNENILNKIKDNLEFNFISSLEDGNPYYFTFEPVQVGKTKAPWSLAIAVSIKEVNKLANETLNMSIIAGLIGLFCLSIVIWILSKNITNPLYNITKSLESLTMGEIGTSMKTQIRMGDEIAEMGEAFNTSIEGLNKKARFAALIGQGRLDTDIELLGEEDVLGKSLIEMRNSLKNAKEEEKKRYIEEEQRRWTNEGSAVFGDVLRQNNDNLIELSYEVIKNLVSYLKANQGGIFIINDNNEENKILELKAAFALNEKKYFEKRINLGEGLVGTCAIEKMRIYMTNIPQDYIEVTSGLGNAKPTSLLLVPLKLEEEILGVIEIASFNEFVDYEIEFIEKIAGNVASSISSVRMNAQTSELLAQSKQQAEELISQEEEMRQNMEELQATQEEATRNKMEMEGLINALNSSSFVVEYDMNKKLTFINDAYLAIHEMKREDVVGLYHHDNMEFTDEQWKNYEQFWADLKNGVVKRQRSVFTMKGKKYELLEVFTPVKDEIGEVFKVIKIANDMDRYR